MVTLSSVFLLNSFPNNSNNNTVAIKVIHNCSKLTSGSFVEPVYRAELTNMSGTKGGVCKIMIIADKWRGGVMQMLTIAKKGGGRRGKG